jgi:acetyl-CoA acetyltransferase
VSAAVVGLGASRFSRRTGATEASLAARAIVAALRDARVAPADVDGVVRYDRDALWEYDLPGVLRLGALPFYVALPRGAGSAPALLRMAAMAITEGLATTVLCYHACSRTQPAPADAAARLARRRGIDEREIADVTRAHRRSAARNPQAIVRGALSRRSQPYVAAPLREADVAPPSAGACAFVVARARPGGVAILASMQAGIPSAVRHPEAWARGAPLARVARAARAMFRAARLRPADVDVACLNADASALVPIARRVYGVTRARVNPHGGQLCEAALDGVNDVAEAVRQLRGRAADQVRGARIALVAGSLLEPTSAVLLGRTP